MIELKILDGKRLRRVQFEHSLVSLSKWEAKHKIAFQGRQAKSPDQMLDYFADMILSRKVDPDIVYRLTPEQLDELTNYINSSQTASSIPKEKSTGIQETMTAELIYYWMIELGIPFEPTNTWHLSQCLMLVEMTAFKKSPPKKRKASEVWKDWASANEQNKKILGIKD